MSDTEFVDLIDGALSADRARHVEHCAACRAKADELAAALTAAATDDVPEPSPLFWDQLSARVRTAVANEHHPGSFRRLLEPTKVRWIVLASAAVLVLAIGLRPANIFHRSSEPAPAETLIADQTDAIADDDTFGDIDTDEGWALVRTFADDLAVEDIDAAGVAAHPGSAEGMVLRLSDRERIELAQLLQDEIKRHRRTEASS